MPELVILTKLNREKPEIITSSPSEKITAGSRKEKKIQKNQIKQKQIKRKFKLKTTTTTKTKTRKQKNVLAKKRKQCRQKRIERESNRLYFLLNTQRVGP